MTETVFKAPKSKKSPPRDEVEEVPTTANKRPRTSEDFYLFCKFILEYENYETIKEEEKREKTASPQESTESTENAESIIKSDNTESSSSRETVQESTNSTLKSDEEDNYDLVTCYCEKPFAGRPMIECCQCLTWIHLKCAKIKKTQIPEVFLCIKCKSSGRFNRVPPPSASLRHKKRVRMTV